MRFKKHRYLVCTDFTSLSFVHIPFCLHLYIWVLQTFVFQKRADGAQLAKNTLWQRRNVLKIHQVFQSDPARKHCKTISGMDWRRKKVKLDVCTQAVIYTAYCNHSHESLPRVYKANQKGQGLALVVEHLFCWNGRPPAQLNAACSWTCSKCQQVEDLRFSPGNIFNRTKADICRTGRT